MEKIEFVNIRNAEINDFDEIFLLLKQLWPDRKLNKRSLQNVFEHLIKSDHEELFCAEIEGKMVGFCTLAIRNSLWQEGYMCHICELVVDEAFRGKSIGTDLIKTASEVAKKRGCKKIELDSAFNRKRAHNFYNKIGFENRAYLFSKNL